MMDVIGNLAEATRVSYAEIFMELFVDPEVHSELFQRFYNESFFNKRIRESFSSFKASFPEVDKMILPVYSFGSPVSPDKLIENEVSEYHKIGHTYYLIEKTGDLSYDTGNEDVVYISKKCTFKRNGETLDYTDSIIDFSTDLSAAKEKIERAALISRTSGKDLKKDHVKYLLRDMKVDFPNSEFNQNKVFDILAEQRVLAI
jgi:hypothetical protein